MKSGRQAKNKIGKGKTFHLKLSLKSKSSTGGVRSPDRLGMTKRKGISWIDPPQLAWFTWLSGLFVWIGIRQINGINGFFNPRNLWNPRESAIQTSASTLMKELHQKKTGFSASSGLSSPNPLQKGTKMPLAKMHASA
jgi:hypothetical protein